MKQNFITKLITLGLTGLLMLNLVQVSTIYASEISITDILTEDDVLKSDPIRLINLAILNNVDFTKITYEEKTILDVLTAEQTNAFINCEARVTTYSEAFNDTKAALAAGADTRIVIEGGNRAYSLYSDNIADVSTIQMTREEIENTIYEYIKAASVGTVSVDLHEERLPDILCNYALRSILVNEKLEENEVMTNYGLVVTTDKKLVCDSTTWYLNGINLKALFSGTVSEITDTSVTVSIGTNTTPITITYSTDSQIDLVDKNLQVGSNINQEDEILTADNVFVTIQIKYGSEPLDLLYMLGSTVKVLVLDYQHESLDEYNEQNNKYISELMDYEFNGNNN